MSAKVEVALAFGRLARLLLARFDQAYGYVDQHGWVADANAVANSAFPADDMEKLRSACNGVLEATESKRFRQLQFHGPELITLLSKLTFSQGLVIVLITCCNFTEVCSDRVAVAVPG